jgi:hypothetical protein
MNSLGSHEPAKSLEYDELNNLVASYISEAWDRITPDKVSKNAD